MGAELDHRELKEAMRAMDADGSGEIDFDEFYAWMRQTRKQSRKIAKVVSDFAAKRAAGATRQEQPYGRPTNGRAGDATFARAKDAYLPYTITRKKMVRSERGVFDIDIASERGASDCSYCACLPDGLLGCVIRTAAE
jgi:hypothetical protein